MSNYKTEEFLYYYESPIGVLEIRGCDNFINSVLFVESEMDVINNAPEILKSCAQQLDEYFNKKRTKFDLSLRAHGTGFQKKVWDTLPEIHFGATASYSEIAKRIGNHKAVRAVGAANGKNPIIIIVPCHRIIGSNGKLVGFGGGLWRKKWLLQHEQNLLL